jgi:orotate phosphoribosyltransferase
VVCRNETGSDSSIPRLLSGHHQTGSAWLGTRAHGGEVRQRPVHTLGPIKRLPPVSVLDREADLGKSGPAISGRSLLQRCGVGKELEPCDLVDTHDQRCVLGGEDPWIAKASGDGLIAYQTAIGNPFMEGPGTRRLPLEGLAQGSGGDQRSKTEATGSLQADRDLTQLSNSKRSRPDPTVVVARCADTRHDECTDHYSPPPAESRRRGLPRVRQSDSVLAMNHRDQLKRLLVERSLRLGDFTLASGARSNYYIDARPTTMSAEGQMLIGHIALALLKESGLEPTHVGGLTMGADPIAYAVAHRSYLDGHPIDGFSVRKKAKEHGTGQRVEGGVTPESRCVMVEDSMSTGKSTLAAVQAVLDVGASVLGVLTVVDRSENATALFESEGLPLLSIFTGNEILEAAKPASP